MFDRFYHGAVLHWIKLDLFLFFHLFQPALHHLFRHFTVYVQIMEHLRRIQFQIIIVGRIDPYLTVRFFHHCLALDTQIHDIFFDILNLYFQQRTGSLQQNLLRKVIGFNIMDSAIFLLLASLGYIDGGVAPIVGDRGFDPLYINPIPSGLVLTGIVVSVSITAFSLALIQRIYRRYGTIEMRELLERAKKEDD